MGLVFDPERVAAGRIPLDPNGQAQYDGAAILGSSLAELAIEQPRKNPELLAYLLYGSAVKFYMNEATRRSDIDLLVVTDDSSNSGAIQAAVGSRIQAVEHGLDIDVNAIIYDRKELEGSAKINPFYSEHLSNVRGVVWNSDFQHFSPAYGKMASIEQALFGRVPFVDAWPFADAYLRARRAKFQSQLDQVEPNLTDLKGAFELPRNMGRMLGDMFEKYVIEHTDSYDPERDDIDTPFTYGDSPQERLLIVARETDTLGLIGDDVAQLSAFDEEYTKLLEDTIARNTSVRHYEGWLRGFYEQAMERAFKLVSVADQLVQRTVELAQVDPNYDQVVFDAANLHPDYMDQEEYFREQDELEHRAGQIVPVAYDLDKLLFTIAPKHPEMAERYRVQQKERAAARRESDKMAVEWAFKGHLALERERREREEE